MIAMYFEPKAMKLKTVFMETHIFFLTWLDFIITFTNMLFGLSWGRGNIIRMLIEVCIFDKLSDSLAEFYLNLHLCAYILLIFEKFILL